MKQFFTIAVILLSFQLFGQKKIVWFDMGVKAQYGATGLYNAAIADSDKYDYTISTGYSYGAKLGINFGYNGLAIDVMRSTAKQEIQIPGSASAVVNWQALDVYALFRNAKNLGYFEIGPKISFVSKVEDNLAEAGIVNPNGAVTDRTADYNKNNIAGVIGFGANIMGNDGAFSGILGLRLEYAFTDFVVGPESPATSVAAPLRDPSIYADGYKKSNVAFAGLVFELNWGIGYFAKAQCGARSKFIMF